MRGEAPICQPESMTAVESEPQAPNLMSTHFLRDVFPTDLGPRKPEALRQAREFRNHETFVVQDLAGIIVLGSTRETLLNPTCGSLKRGLIDRVYIPKGPPFS